MSNGAGPIAAVLWDADGVLQHHRGDWVAKMRAIGGKHLPEALWEAEGPALRGEEPFTDGIRRALAKLQLGEHFTAIVDSWTHVDIDPAPPSGCSPPAGCPSAPPPDPSRHPDDEDRRDDQRPTAPRYRAGWARVPPDGTRPVGRA